MPASAQAALDATSLPRDRSFSITEALRFARGAYRAHALRFSGLFLAMVLLWALLEVLVVLGGSLGPIYNVGLHLLYLWAVSIPEATLIQASLDMADGREPQFRETLRDVRLSLRFFAAKMLFLLAVAAGVVLALVPGIYLALRFQFVEYVIVDRRCGPLAAFRLGSQTTRGALWRIFLFEALLLVAHAVGASFLALGLLFTIPAAALASAFVFRALGQSRAPRPGEPAALP